MAVPEREHSFRRIVEDVWATLKPLGYRKNGQKFCRHAAENVALIEFQRSQTSDANHIRFTLNLGVVSSELLNRLDPEKDINNIGIAEAHLRARIGDLLPSQDDHWWLLSASADEGALRTEVAECVVSRVVPYLDQVGSDEALLALWRSDKSPGLTDGLRQRYLTILLA